MKKNLIFILFLIPILCFGQIVTGQTLGSKNGISTPSKILGKNGIFIPTRKQSISVVVPTVITITKSVINFTSEGAGGNVTSDGGATIIARGVCWGTSATPIVSGSHTTNGTGTGSFTSAMTSLDTTSTWHYRAYATNSAGTGYGIDSIFTIRAKTLIYDALLDDQNAGFVKVTLYGNTLGHSVGWACGTNGDQSWYMDYSFGTFDFELESGTGIWTISFYDPISIYHYIPVYKSVSFADDTFGITNDDTQDETLYVEVTITHKVPYNP